MEKINLISLNTNFQTIRENKALFIKGQTIQGEVLTNTQTGVLLKISNIVVEAQTKFRFPIGSQLFLTVVNQNEQQIILSLNNDSNFYKADVSLILHNLGLDDSPELRLIINKLIQNKEKISREKIDFLKLVINKLPLAKEDSLNLLYDPSLYLAIFNFLDKDKRFSILLNGKKNRRNKEKILEINILYQSKNLGHILINLLWCEKVKIELTSSLNSTFRLIMANLNSLKEKITSLTGIDIEITTIYDGNLAKNIHWVNEPIQAILGIDIRI